MRKLFYIAIFLLCNAKVFSQIMQTNSTPGGYQFVNLKVTDGLWVAKGGVDTPNVGTIKVGQNTTGMMYYDTVGHKLYFRVNPRWIEFAGGGSVDTSNLSHRIDTLSDVVGFKVDSVVSFLGNEIDTLAYYIGGTRNDFYYTQAANYFTGGYVTYTGIERTYYVSIGYYRIGVNIGTIPAQNVTVDALADPDSSRIDVIYANTENNTYEVLEGVESANPVKPTLTNPNYIERTFVTLTSAAPSGITDTTIVFDGEGTQWAYRSATGVTVNFTSTAQAYHLTHSADVGSIGNNDVIGFGDPVPVDASTKQGISFFIKQKAVMPNNKGMLVGLFSNGVLSGNEVGIPLNRSTTDWQGFSIPITSFNLTNTSIDSVRFRFSGGGADYVGFYLDYVYFQNGLQPVQPSVSEKWIIQGDGIRIDSTANTYTINSADRFGVLNEDDDAAQDRTFNLNNWGFLMYGTGSGHTKSLSALATSTGMAINATTPNGSKYSVGEFSSESFGTNKIMSKLRADSLYLLGPTVSGSPINYEPTTASLTDYDALVKDKTTGALVSAPTSLFGGGSAITSLNTDVVATGPGAAVATIQPNVVTNSKLRPGAANSVIGRAGNTIGNVDDIVASTPKTLLGYNGTIVGFAAIDSSWMPSGFHTLGYLSTIFQAMLNGTGYVKMSGTTPAYRSNAQLTSDVNTFTQTLSGAVPAPTTLNGYFLKDDGTWAAAGGGSGTVTSVGLTMPSAFSVAGTPVTTSGTLLVTGSGTTSQYIRGDGSLATYTTINSDSLAVRKFGSSTNLIHIISHNSGYNSSTVGSSAAGARVDSANLYIGLRTALSNTTAYRNIALGRAAYKSATTGFNNIAIGDSAMGNSTITGQQNIGIGTEAGRGLTSGNFNVYMGYATKPTTTGSNNIFLGGNNWGSAQTNLTGNANIGIGYRLMESLGSGGYNIAIGGADDVTGAFPLKTLNANVSGSYNVAIGAGALAVITGSNSTGIGRNAGNGVSGTGEILAIGTGSAYMTSSTSLSTGTVAIGNNALGVYGSTGNPNTGVGYEAGQYALNTGGGNTFVGYRAGRGLGTNSTSRGVNNTYVGYHAGNNGSDTAEDNTMVGVPTWYSTSSSGLKDAFRNVWIGNINTNTSSGNEDWTGDDNIFVGTVTALSRTTSNSFILGSNTINWALSTLSGSDRSWTINGTNTTVTANTAGVTLDVTGTGGGFRPNQMTGAQAEAINGSSPPDGIIVYITNGNGSTVNSVGFWGRSGGAWVKFH